MSQTHKNMLDLESLTKKYDNLLIQYNQAQVDYANYLNKNSSNSANKDLTSIKGSVVFDSGFINKKASTLQQCVALCSTDSTCKSATFNPIDYAQPQCWLNKNEGNIIPAPGSNNYSIIPKERQLLSNINSLNLQLADVNSKILKFIQGNKNLYTQIMDNRNIQFNQLQKNLVHLKFERMRLNNQINEFEDLDEQQNYTSLSTNKNYYGYLFLVLLFLICLIILSKIIINKVVTDNRVQELNSNEIFISVMCILLILGLIYFLTKNKKT